MIPCYRTHGSRQQVNNKKIQEEYKICVLAAKAYSYVFQFGPYQGAKKGKQVASSTKWGLGENVVLRMMECLTETFSFYIFKDNYFTSFDLLTHYELTTFEKQVCLTKMRYTKTLSLGRNNWKKGKVATLNGAHQAKKQCNFDSG